MKQQIKLSKVEQAILKLSQYDCFYPTTETMQMKVLNYAI